MEKRSTEDRTETNGKIDSLHKVLTEFRKESWAADEEQDGRIGKLERWQSGKIAVGRWAAAIGSVAGAGMVTVILWLIFGEKID